MLAFDDLKRYETVHTWACLQRPQEKPIGMAMAVHFTPLSTCFADLFPGRQWYVRYDRVFMDGRKLFTAPYWMARAVSLCDRYRGVLIDCKAFREILVSARA